MDVFPDWEKIHTGQYITFVAGSVLLDNNGAHLVFTCDFPRRTVVVKGELGKVEHQYAFLQVRVDQISPIITCQIDANSVVLPIGPCHREDMGLLTELCCGMGAWSSVAGKAGYHVVAGVDSNHRWQQLFTAVHQDSARFIVGDCASPVVVAKLHSLGSVHSTLIAGVNCQPFSSGGDKRGLDDPRSSSLHKVLQTAWVLQCPVIILECVVGVQSDRRFQEVLQQFCTTTGYSLTQQSLELADMWCTHRLRWFAVLTAPPVGKIFVPPLPPMMQWKTVGKVIPKWQQWPEDHQEQIQLTLYELDKFHQFVKGGIDKCFVNDSKTLPTCLHSAGNQLYPCKCGCRGPLSLERLAERGLYGVLVPSNNTIHHDGKVLQLARYLHPAEMYLLNGGDPSVHFGEDLRLALAAIGQCVAPIQGLWVLTQVQSAIEHFLMVPRRNPLEAVSKHVSDILLARQSLWGNDHADDEVPAAEDKTDHAIQDVSTGTYIRFVASSEATLEQFYQAEQQLNGSFNPIGLPETTLLQDIQQDMYPEPVETQGICEIPFDDEDFMPTGSALVGLSMQALMDIVCPIVDNVSECQSLRSQTISEGDRIAILEQQNQVWADDEMLWHLNRIQAESPKEQQVHVWDPLLLSSVVRFGKTDGLRKMAACVKQDTTIITAMIDRHWFPIVWRRVGNELLTYTCGLPFQYSLAHQVVISCVADAMEVSAQPLNNRKMSFLIPTACGALAIAFVRHLVQAADFPSNFQELQSIHKEFRAQFVEATCQPSSRPWIWGAGDETLAMLKMLLQEHGVHESDTQDRIQMICNKLGKSAVDHAMRKPQPWKELKWIANQNTPVVQLIKPSELEATIAKKAKSGQQIGRKAQKQKKANGQQSSKILDPAVLRLEHGVFVCGHQNTPLSQIAVNQMGPNANGVVLCNQEVAMMYLRGGKQISTGGLAMIVLDAGLEPLQTQLIAEPVKLPLICTVNSEPVLAAGQMFQLGAFPVTKNKKADQFDLVTVSTCVAKFAVFRDETKEEWSNVVAHPMKHLFRHVPPLVACSDPECDGSCENWHSNATFQLAEPILEVWGRQWLTLQFGVTEPSKADIFMVCIRLPQCMKQQMQSYSGESGVYPEPKGVNGRTPSEEFHVCWLPRANHAEVTLLKQTVQHVVGLARMGNKYGLRCLTIHAEQLHLEVKPTSSFLPAGRKQVYLIGPMPYGVVKSSIVAAVEGIGWKARPMQPVATSSGEDGIMWKIQALQPPAKTVISASWGDIVVTRLEDPHISVKTVPNVVGASRTVQLCSTGSGSDRKQVDPLQQVDPWANFRPASGHSGMDKASISDPVDVLEQRILTSVMAKMPGSMEVESEPASSSNAKIHELEKHIEELRAGQGQLHQMVCEQGQSQGQQIQQLAVQTANIEHAVSDQAGRLTQFQGQFRAQIEHQQTQLDSLFKQQMAKLEELISKKQRTE